MICNDFLELDLPLTWEDLGAIATALAVIVALWANHNSSKQLQKTLQMHEQTKGVDLMYTRMEWIDKIDADDFRADHEIGILFNNEISSECCELENLIKARNHYKADLKIYDERLKDLFPNMDESAPMSSIKKIEYECISNEPRNGEPESTEYKRWHQKFIETCKTYEIIARPNKMQPQLKLYNYSEIKKKLCCTEKAIENCRKNLKNLMWLFIKESIKPLAKGE